MGEIISIIPAGKKKAENEAFSRSFDQLLRTASDDAKYFKAEGEPKIIMHPEEYARQKMNHLLLEEKIMDPDLFRCVLYASAVVAKTFHETPESFYITDYLIRGQEENDPAIIKEGADCCFLLCSFFPQRAERKGMTLKGLFQLGIHAYFSLYTMTRSSMGLCMGERFPEVVDIAQRSMRAN